MLNKITPVIINAVAIIFIKVNFSFKKVYDKPITTTKLNDAIA